MAISDRIEGSVEKWSQQWKDRLAGWLVQVGKTTSEGVAKQIKPESKEPLKDTLESVLNDPDAPDEVKVMASRILPEWSPLQSIIGEVVWFVTSLTSIISGNEVFRREWEQYFDSKERTYRLDPGAVMTAWRRDPDNFTKYLGDLMVQGWSDDRIEVLKKITEVIPGVQDLIRMSVREAFSPEIAEKFGQYEDPPVNVYPWTAKQGLSQEWTDRYWAAHWDLPSASQGYEMLRRGIIDQDTLKLLLRALDVMPFWRDKLLGISWEIPTRVDVRRFYDLRTIDETRLREIYQAQGYHDKDLDDYVLWTKIYVEFPDLLARWKNGWLTLDEVKSRLVALGMNDAAAEELVQTKVKATETDPTIEAKQLTKTEIYKGVKMGVISYSDGVELLMRLDYTQDQADFLLITNVQTLTGSPENLVDFFDMTEKYRQAQGLANKPVPESLKQAAQRVTQLDKDVKLLEDAVKKLEDQLIQPDQVPESIRPELDKSKSDLAHAQIMLAEARSTYNTELARWRSGG